MFHCIYVLSWRDILMLMPIMTILSAILVIMVKTILKDFRWVYTTLFFVWSVVVIYVTLISRPTGNYWISLKPFASYEWALTEPEYYRANFMNILLFFPGGVMLGLSMYDKKKVFIRAGVAILLLVGMSISIEALQYFLRKGTIEIDDVIHNTLGAIFGVGAALTVEWISFAICDERK